MGQMAQIAEQHYKEFLPTAYKAMSPAERTRFFQMLEDDAAEQIADLADSLTPPATPGETYPETQSRLAYGQSVAASQIFREVLLPTPEPETQPPDRNPEIEAGLRQAMADFEEARESLTPE